MNHPTAHDLLFRQFETPPTAFGPIPFWFWNDHLDEAELLRQLHAFHAAGCGGVIPHARIGLSPEIGYLSDHFLQLMQRVVEEAATLGMKIILYDEASYPSGSARGAVAAENPDYVSQAIGLWQKQIEGPIEGFWRPDVGRALRDRHVTSCAGLLHDGVVDPDSLSPLEPQAHDVLPYNLGPGQWLLMSVWNTDSGGHIRGAYPYEESGSALAPAAGDILNPAAVAAFVRLTHDRYAEALGEHFGTTIIALFTDEPSVFGKGVKRPAQAQPYTPGLVQWLQSRLDESQVAPAFDLSTWLPALWADFGPQTDTFRQAYADGIQTRLHEVFYAAQARWCESHSLALTGHPSASNDTASLERFHLPGQDMVWRYVMPGAETALEGAHSVAPKAATAAARRTGSRRSLTEVCGAYGWDLTLAETKWLFDWHLVRGNNLINPHAFFYSIAGRRAFESEPDLGLHNVWWPSISHVLRYAGRVSWLLADAEIVSQTAVVGTGHDLPWLAASLLLQRQHDFDYLTPPDLLGGKAAEGQWIHSGGARYRRLIIDLPPEQHTTTLSASLAAAREAGVEVIDGFTTAPQLGDMLNRLDEKCLDRPVWAPASSRIRLRHVRKSGADFILVLNEGLEPVAGDLWVPLAGRVELWDALRGRRHTIETTNWVGPAGAGVGQWVEALWLDPFESVVIVIDPDGQEQTGSSMIPAPTAPHLHAPPSAHLQAQTVQTLAFHPEWTVTDTSGNLVDVAAGADWSRQPGWELFSGTLVYRAHITLEHPARGLDLGRVGDLAEVFLDDVHVGAALWAPHIVRTMIGPGEHELRLHVTNSMVNEFEGAQRPSGWIGPLSLLL